MKKKVSVCVWVYVYVQCVYSGRGVRGSHKNLRGLRPLPCVLCCLSDLENPGKKDRTINCSHPHPPSSQTCEITRHSKRVPSSNLVAVFADVAVSLGRIWQHLELAFVLALSSEAPLQEATLLILAGGWPLEPTSRWGPQSHTCAWVICREDSCASHNPFSRQTYSISKGIILFCSAILRAQGGIGSSNKTAYILIAVISPLAMCGLTVSWLTCGKHFIWVAFPTL